MPESSIPILPFVKSYAFLIGIDAYQHVSPLRTAVKDATDIAALLEDTSKHGYEVHLLTDPGKQEIEAFLARMKELVQPADRIIFYFAGHGIAIDSIGDPEGFIVPADADPAFRESLLSMDVLHKTLLDLPCKHGLLILDCCFAGSFKWSTGHRGLDVETSEILYAERFWRFVEHPAWQVITSSAHDQKAADLINHQALGLREEEATETNNSPFAWAFKQAIDLHSKADTQGMRRSDGVVTATELYLYLREIVLTSTQESQRQSPAMFTLSKHDTKGEFIFLNPGHKLNLPEAPDTNPYKGLVPYEASPEDAKTFFGREQAIGEMVQKLAYTFILVVSAASGQGKSSVVKAGLLPKISQANDPQPIVLRPGDRNFEAWSQLAILDLSGRQLVLIDQYEEMFSLEQEDRIDLEQSLIALTTRLSKAENPGLKIILTIRSDFEWQLKASVFGQIFWSEPDLRNFLYRLSPMTQEELREIMVKPAWVVAYEFDSEELIQQILEEIRHAPGALPLLSFTLHQLYEKRDRDQRLLTEKAYKEDLKGVNGALSTYADRIYHQLTEPAQQDFMRKLMLRMVRLNDGSYSRRRVYHKTPSNMAANGFIDELDYPDHLDATKNKVLEILAEAQLVVNGRDQFGPYVEPMHDSLLNFWPRCLQWINDFGRENLVLQRQLWQAVVEHHQWRQDIYSTPDGREPQAPLWDNNPKLQQVQLSVTDPRNEWLCKKGWANKSISSIAFLLWEREGTEAQQDEMSAWNWYFQEEDPAFRYQKVQACMDHWLNEEELVFVKRSFEEQQSELEKAIAQRNAALAAQKKAEVQLERTLVAIRSANTSGQVLKKQILSGNHNLAEQDIRDQLLLTSIILENERDRSADENINIRRGYFDADLSEAYVWEYVKSAHAGMGASLQQLFQLRMEERWVSLTAFDFAPNAITYLQFFLCQAGFLLFEKENRRQTKIWGIYGYETLAGVRLFQEYLRVHEAAEDGLHFDIPEGTVGANTWQNILRWARDNKRSHYDFHKGPVNMPESEIWFRLLTKLHEKQKAKPSRIQQLIDAFPEPSDTRKINDWNLDPGEVHLIGIRRNASLRAEVRENDDLFVLLLKGWVFKFWGTTDPNPCFARSDGEPYMVEGQHAYQISWFKISDPERVHQALQPASRGILVFRSKNRDYALDESDQIEGPNLSIPFQWTGSGKSNWSGGASAIAGGSYINPENKVVDCHDFAAVSPRRLEEGKTRAAFNVLMDLLTLCMEEHQLVHYSLILESDLELDPENFSPDYAATLLQRLNP